MNGPHRFRHRMPPPNFMNEAFPLGGQRGTSGPPEWGTSSADSGGPGPAFSFGQHRTPPPSHRLPPPGLGFRGPFTVPPPQQHSAPVHHSSWLNPGGNSAPWQRSQSPWQPPRQQHPQHSNRHNQQRGKQFPANKVKEEFFCETCDRGFKSNELFNVHVSEHQKCRVKGCNYVAAPKLVKIHYQTQHVTGFADKIWSLESKADIEKWRQERRKNFPTKQRVFEKEIEIKEKEARGEVLQTKEFGKMYKGRGRGRGRRSWNKGRDEPVQEGSFDQLLSEAKSCQAQALDQKQIEKPSSGGLGLLSSYITDSEEEKEEEHVTRADSIRQTEKEAVKPEKQKKKFSPKKNKKRKRGQQSGAPPPKLSKGTLLEKLLASEIRHERNVLLQCVRYVVKTDFLGVGSQKKAEGKETSSCDNKTVNVGDSSRFIDDDIWQGSPVHE